MASVAELAARAHREVAHLLVLEGCPFAFTDRAEIVGTGGFSWIADEDRRVLEGLTVPESITYSTSLESGMLESDDGATFVVQDFDSELIAFLAVPDADTVGELLRPLDDPAPTDLVSADGQTDVPVWGRWVNGEAIGQFGERNRFQVFPGDPMPGPSHAAYVGDVQTLAVSVVTDAPTHLEGRRVALYRIFRDVTSSAEGYAAWPGWSLQFASGESLVWYGTLRAMSGEARTWKLACDGPSSWLRKQLNTCRPATWERITTSLGLDDTPGAREDLIALELSYVEGGTGLVALGASSLFDETDDLLPTSGTPGAYRTAINARLSALAAIAGPDLTWGTYYNAEGSLQPGYATTKIDDQSGYAACWRLTMSEKVWRYLGYDPLVQQAKLFESALEIRFVPAATLQAQGLALPGPGYWAAEFSTTPLGFPSPQSANTHADNDGTPRNHLALTPEGVNMLYPGGGQELVVGLGPSAPFIEGQLNRPPGEHAFTDGGGDADSTGYFAFRASYRTSLDEEPTTMVQIAKCSWANDGSLLGAMFGANASSERQLYLERYVDPRWFGCDRKLLDHVWASLDLEYCPFAFIGYNEKFGDRADLVLLRTLLSTGTASWTGYDGEGAVRTLGANSHPDAVYDEGSDVEIADLGLGVYHALIDWGSFKDTAAQLPAGGGSSPLNRAKYGFVGSFDSQELIARILEPRGWNLGLVRGQLRLFSLARPLVVDDAEVVIEPDDFASDDQMFVETVNLRPLTPKDKFRLTYGKALVEEAAAEGDLAVEVRAQDPASRTRHSNAEQEIDGAGMVPVALWKGVNAPPNWQGAWAELWSTTIAGWAGSPQVMVEDVPLLWSKARLLGPGSVVRFSSYFGPGREGVYGLTNKVGRVVKLQLDLHTLTAKVSILLQPGSATASRRFAPVAFVVDDTDKVEGRHNATTRKFFCYANAFGHDGASAHDVRAFAEPDGYGVGGDAVVHGWQWDGGRWSQSFSFEVESVSTGDDSITYKPGSLTGTWHEGQYTALVLAPWDDQPADSWPRALFSVITASNFKFGSGPTPGFKLT